jgi:hypothetical protein
LGLTPAIFNYGLEEIGAYAFVRCTALIRIVFPPTSRAIKGQAFVHCRQSLTMILNDGLEEIGEVAFVGTLDDGYLCKVPLIEGPTSPEHCAHDLRSLTRTRQYLLITGPTDSHVE